MSCKPPSRTGPKVLVQWLSALVSTRYHPVMQHCTVTSSRSVWWCLVLMQTAWIAAAVLHRSDPVILPFFHSGMARVMPLKRSLPGVGHTVEVAVGQPLDISNITCRCNQQGEHKQAVQQQPRCLANSLAVLKAWKRASADGAHVTSGSRSAATTATVLKGC